MLDPVRFARLAAAHWAEQRRGWAWFLFAGTLLIALLYVFATAVSGTTVFTVDVQEAFFTFTLLLSAPVFAGRYFIAMSRPESALLVLTRPASSLEKWLLALLVVAVAYPLAYVVAFELVNVPAAVFSEMRAAHLLAAMSEEARETSAATALAPASYGVFVPWRLDDEFPAGELLSMYLFVVGLQGFAMLGSLYFPRAPFIKTILAALVLVIVLAVLGAIVDGSPERVFDWWHERSENETAWGNVVGVLFWFAVPALLWLASFFALQERELHR